MPGVWSDSGMQRLQFNGIPPKIHGKVSTRRVQGSGLVATEVTFSPGARWSNDVGSASAEQYCSLPHIGVVIQGMLRAQMKDGSLIDFSAGEIMVLPPGHDVWTISDQACVFIEISVDEGRT
jgi:hypothetical protein